MRIAPARVCAARSGLVRLAVALAFAACSGRGEPPAAPARAPVDTVVTDTTIAPAISADAAVATADAADVVADAAPATLADALAELRRRGFAAAADAIARREAQVAPKMKLSPAQALATAQATLAVADRPAFVALHAVMPRSTVELARAVRERGVTLADADDIAGYLVRVTRALRFERLERFDENHSHVTGRDWPDIDYTGEGMTWQNQKADWSPKGVLDFKTQAHLHAYFTGAEKLPHWEQVYRPRGKMADLR